MFKSMKEWISVVVAIGLFGGMMWVMANFWMWIIAAIVVYALVVIGVNAVYKNIMGRDMSWYTMLMNEGKKQAI